jgi:lysophospholipase L1-like esterase
MFLRPRQKRGSSQRWAPSAPAVILALLLPLLVAATCAGAGIHSKSVTRIMPLGDSITDGYGIPGGYRIDLWRELKSSRIDFDFVGSQRNGPAQLPDKDHEGHIGWRIDQLRASVDGWIRTYQPDVVLLLIGTNDILRHYRVARAPRRLGALVDRIYAVRPATKIFLSTIPLIGIATANVQVAKYNAAVRQVVRTRAAARRPIWFVDGGRRLTSVDLADAAHPNAAGYWKLAQAWHASLVRVLSKTRHATANAPDAGLQEVALPPTLNGLASRSRSSATQHRGFAFWGRPR